MPLKILYRTLLLGSVLLLFLCKENKTNQEILLLTLSGDSLSVENSNQTCPKNVWNFSNVFLANKITEAPGATGIGFKDPSKAINGICGAGKLSGSLDVYSLQSSPSSTHCISNEKCIVLEWDNKKVKNADGIDFVVFENPFCLGGEANCEYSRFMEPIIVEVSIDRTNWCGWNPEYLGGTNESDKKNPNNWLRFAGVEPVLFHQENWIYSENDIFDKTKAGGDGFDLSDPNFGNDCNSSIKTQIQNDGFIFLRLTSAISRGFSYPNDSFDQTADIDGVVAKSVENR